MRKRIMWQAGLTILVLVLTVAIVFAMTAAWTTNIVQTSGLQFKAESWAFEQTISVVTDAISASPGDVGAIELVAENTNQDTAAVTVSISKNGMKEEMLNRLYFYVDTQTVRNGEVMDRVYLNSQESYTYVVLSGQTLSLTADSYNDAPLKWQWVYDVLGYYVIGQASNDVVAFSEYLRPIEYIYDPATTEFEMKNGVPSKLLSINGVTVKDFLEELSAHDGYAGKIDVSKVSANGYYPVDVDENGYGVYAYLCSYGEIEAATNYDTQLGEAAAQAAENNTPVTPYEATLTISTENYREVIETAATLSDINAVLAEGAANVIQLSGDLTIGSSEQLIIPENREITLDLNEHQIISQTTGTMIQVGQGSELTITDGSVAGTAGSEAIYGSGAQVTLSNVDLTGFKTGVHIVDGDSTLGLDSTVRLIGCTLDTTSTAVLVLGNGTTSAANTQVVIQDCKIYSDGIAISGNGTATGAGNWGTDIQIIDSEIISDPGKLGAGIYHPQKNSTLTVYNSTISGYTGIAIKGGSVSIVKSTVTGKGSTPNEPVFIDSGFADTGDGIYIETNYGYEISLEISENSVIQSDNGLSLQVFEETATHVDVNIISGTFKEAQPDAYIAVGSEQNGTVVTVIKE